jgi:hypothetical protein
MRSGAVGLGQEGREIGRRLDHASPGVPLVPEHDADAAIPGPRPDDFGERVHSGHLRD